MAAHALSGIVITRPGSPGMVVPVPQMAIASWGADGGGPFMTNRCGRGRTAREGWKLGSQSRVPRMRPTKDGGGGWRGQERGLGFARGSTDVDPYGGVGAAKRAGRAESTPWKQTGSVQARTAESPTSKGKARPPARLWNQYFVFIQEQVPASTSVLSCVWAKPEVGLGALRLRGNWP